jgi:hypothetical protein
VSGGLRKQAQFAGVRIAQEALLAAKEDDAQGAYIMPPLNNRKLTVRVIEAP